MTKQSDGFRAEIFTRAEPEAIKRLESTLLEQLFSILNNTIVAQVLEINCVTLLKKRRVLGLDPSTAGDTETACFGSR